PIHPPLPPSVLAGADVDVVGITALAGPGGGGHRVEGPKRQVDPREAPADTAAFELVGRKPSTRDPTTQLGRRVVMVDPERQHAVDRQSFDGAMDVFALDRCAAEGTFARGQGPGELDRC